MTKRVRIENADMAQYGVAVEIWDKGRDGAPDTLVDTVKLMYPTAMTDMNVYLTSSRYLIVREIPVEQAT